MDSVQQNLQRKRDHAVHQTTDKLRSMGIGMNHPAYARIIKALDDGDIYSAEEYLSRAQAEDDILWNEPEKGTFHDFFIDKWAALETYLESSTRRPTTIVHEIRARRLEAGPFSIRTVPGKQVEQAASMMDSWYSAKNSHYMSDDTLRNILMTIGFDITSVEIPDSSKSFVFDITTETIADQSRCPVSRYGSEANGRYRIYCYWKREAEDDILNDLSGVMQGPPIIVLYLARMTSRRRRDMAKLCRERRATFILIDELIMLYLCGERGSRLPVMFKCTLPFTYLDPYITTAGLVPPEIFYGRSRELQSLLEGTGGFVFGGRQLGKTALLREAQRRFHSVDEGRIAIWIDLKSEGIGESRKIEEIWEVIANQLRPFGIITNNKSVDVNKLLGGIRKWIEGDSRRRLMLLLDEADRFLDIDSRTDEIGAQGFALSSRLKGLMDTTKRRFKVVFAGLHNVQRTVRSENDPLAHFGDPIVVGPLLSGEELRSALDLVEKPLAAVGYYFESRELAMRILSQTNYYPLLIQMYCKQLVQHMQETRVLSNFDHRTAVPPYIITAKHLDEVYRHRELQEAIRHRFVHLTLRLDPRYEVVAYALAYESLEYSQKAVTGFSVQEIRNLCLDWWGEGFRTLGIDTFRILLEEMCGLGVLKQIQSRYALRTPRLISLMGSKNDIEELLLGVERQVPPGYEASAARGQIDVNAPQLRSALTVQQEYDIRNAEGRVIIIFGTPASGIEYVAQSLAVLCQRSGSKLEVVGEDTLSVSVWRQRAKRMTSSAVVPTLIFVSHQVPWTEDWVQVAQNFVSSYQDRNVRFVFAADAGLAWTLLRSSQNSEEMSNQRVIFSILSPWHDVTLAQWILDCDFAREALPRIRKVTGGWPMLLYRLYTLVGSSPHQLEQQLEALEASMIDEKCVGDELKQFDIIRSELRDTLTPLSLADGGTTMEVQLFTGLPEQVVLRALQTAEMLGLINRSGGDVWSIDPKISELLQRVGE